MRWKPVDYLIAQELEELIAKSTPYALSIGESVIHRFVKGLILSTNIIDEIAKHLARSKHIGVGWGQIIDKKGETLSNECDIIIYKNTPFKEVINQSMRFVLVSIEQAKIVIQVRSSIESVTKDDKTYCKKLKKFVPEVWYISECCWANSKSRVKAIERELKKAGYNQFFYFYRRDANSLERTIDYEPFIKFINLIKKLK